MTKRDRTLYEMADVAAWVKTLIPPPRWDRKAVRRQGQERRADIIARDNATCQLCGTTDGTMHIDHKRPICRGGDSSDGNLWTLCGPCNWSKGKRTVDEYLEVRQRRRDEEASYR